MITAAVFTAGTSPAHWTVAFGGQVMDGAISSNTDMIWLHVAELPQTSDAEYVLVMISLLAQVIFVITSPVWVTVTTPPQLSEVITDAIFAIGTWLAHCTVTSAGQVIEGGVLSKTVIVCAHVAELPHSSVA